MNKSDRTVVLAESLVDGVGRDSQEHEAEVGDRVLAVQVGHLQTISINQMLVALCRVLALNIKPTFSSDALFTLVDVVLTRTCTTPTHSRKTCLKEG